MTRRALMGWMAAGVLRAPAAAAVAAQRREFVAPHMGTLWKLVFFDEDDGHAHQVRDAAWARVGELNARLSDYLEDSELNRLSRDGHLESPSDDLRRVLTIAQTVSEATEGAFDVTVGPLVRLWRASRKEKRLPAPEALAAARKLVGWRALRLTATRIEFLTPGGRLDLGGIAKGFAQDEVRRLIREKHGLTAVLIDAGGGVSVGDPPPGDRGWKVSIAKEGEDEDQTTVWLANHSLATSGEANQFVEIDGVRYAHIVDPQTGLGLVRQIQASVIAADGATADALATACCVMGEERARDHLKSRPGVVARIVSGIGNGRTRVWESKGFDRMTRGR